MRRTYFAHILVLSKRRPYISNIGSQLALLAKYTFYFNTVRADEYQKPPLYRRLLLSRTGTSWLVLPTC
jgi:hypothetical protein